MEPLEKLETMEPPAQMEREAPAVQVEMLEILEEKGNQVIMEPRELLDKLEILARLELQEKMVLEDLGV